MTTLVGFDSNVLLYPTLERKSLKGQAAIELIAALSSSAVIATQAMLEYLAVVRRRRPDRLSLALKQTEHWRQTMMFAPTTQEVVIEAGRLVLGHHLQVWDAVIWAATRAAGAHVLLSEDMHDGLRIGGLTVVNPFKRDVAEVLDLVGR